MLKYLPMGVKLGHQTKRMMITFTSDQYLRLAQAAADHHTNISNYLRKLVDADTGAIVAVQPDDDDYSGYDSLDRSDDNIWEDDDDPSNPLGRRRRQISNG